MADGQMGVPGVQLFTQDSDLSSFDMSAFNRRDARGQFFDPYFITVKFPDDATFTGELLTTNRIKWSNGSVWAKKP
jgi:hypothetical protein